MPNLGMLGGKPCPFRWKDMLRDIGLALAAIASLGMMLAAGYHWLPKTGTNTVKITYELRGIQTQETKDERKFGHYGMLAAFQFAVLQNEQAAASVRPLHKVIKLEYCPAGRPCQNWTPKRYRRVIEGWERSE